MQVSGRDDSASIDEKSFFQVYELPDTGLPVFKSEIYLGNDDNLLAYPCYSGHVFYATTFREGVIAIDVSDPTNPKLLDQIKNFQPYLGLIAVSGDGEKVGVGSSGGLWLLDVTVPSNIVEFDFFATGGLAAKVAVKDNLCFMACNTAGLWILDISDSFNPTPISNLNTSVGLVSDLVVEDSLLFLVSGWLYDARRGLFVINVKDPEHPQILSHYTGIVRKNEGASGPNTIDNCGDRMFISQVASTINDTAIEIINVSNLQNLVREGIFHSDDIVYGVKGLDSVMFVGTANKGLIVLDIHDPVNPTQLANVPVPSSGTTYQEPLVFTSRSHLSIIDVSTPPAPVLVGSTLTHTGAWISDISISGGYGYWADGELGAVDLSVLTDPYPVGLFVYGGGGRGVAAEGRTVYFADGSYGLWILRNDHVVGINQTNTWKVKASKTIVYPNPFNNSVAVNFHLERAHEVRIRIYNILGQIVRTIDLGWQSAGDKLLRWDATADNGTQVASGLYLFRIEAGEQVTGGKLIFVK